MTTTTGKDKHKHKDLYSSRTKRDMDHFKLIQTLFKEHNPFECGKQLVALDSGLVDEKEIVTCDKSEELGRIIQEELNGKAFGEVHQTEKADYHTSKSLLRSQGR